MWRGLATALAGAQSQDEVLAAVADVAGPALGAVMINISLLMDDGLTFRLATVRGTTDQVAEEFAFYSARAPLPSTDALLTGRPVLLHNVAERDRLYPLLKDVEVEQRSFAILPMIDGEHCLGVLGMGWPEEQEFPPEQVAVLQRVGSVCAAALARAYAHQWEAQARAEAQRTAARLISLQQLAVRLASTLGSEDIADAVVDVCLPALHATAVAVAAVDESLRSHMLAAAPDSIRIIDERRFPGTALLQELTAHRQPVLITSRSAWQQWLALAGRESDDELTTADVETFRDQAQSWAFLPLMVDDRFVGIAAFGWDDPRVFADEDVEFLSSVAVHAAIALERARLVDVVRSAADSARAGERLLQALQEVTAGLTSAATSDDIATVLVDHGIGLVADRGVVAVLDEPGRCWRTRTTTGFPSDIAESLSRIDLADAELTPITSVAANGRAVMFESVPDIVARYPAVESSHTATGTESLLVVPMIAGTRPVGALAFGFFEPGPVDAAVQAVAQTLAEVAGQALHRAFRYEAEYQTSHDLQQALLPGVPTDLPGAEAAVCYSPAGAGRDVGGDWYDIFALPRRCDQRPARIGLAVGDVIGHDLRAITVMAQLQPLLRSAALAGASPSEVLSGLDTACGHVSGAFCSTVGYAEYAPDDARLTYACAGHPPPLLISSDGVTYLTGGRSTPLGVDHHGRVSDDIVLHADSVLIWYSDGLVERRRRPIDAGLQLLAEHAARLPRPNQPTWPGLQSWLQALLEVMTQGQTIEDDVVLVALHTARRNDGSAG